MYIPAFCAPTFTQSLISIGQLANKHDVVFTKNKCYLPAPSAAPSTANIIGARGADNLYRLYSPEEKEKKKPVSESAAPAVAPKVKDTNLHKTFNHTKNNKLEWLQKEYPEAIKFILDHGDDESNISCEACVTGK